MAKVIGKNLVRGPARSRHRKTIFRDWMIHPQAEKTIQILLLVQRSHVNRRVGANPELILWTNRIAFRSKDRICRSCIKILQAILQRRPGIIWIRNLTKNRSCCSSQTKFQILQYIVGCFQVRIKSQIRRIVGGPGIKCLGKVIYGRHSPVKISEPCIRFGLQLQNRRIDIKHLGYRLNLRANLGSLQGRHISIKNRRTCIRIDPGTRKCQPGIHRKIDVRSIAR